MNGCIKEGTLVKPKLNPKDLSNEELEFIIRTGKMPPSLVNKENIPNLPFRPTSVQQNMPTD